MHGCVDAHTFSVSLNLHNIVLLTDWTENSPLCEAWKHSSLYLLHRVSFLRITEQTAKNFNAGWKRHHCLLLPNMNYVRDVFLSKGDQLIIQITSSKLSAASLKSKKPTWRCQVSRGAPFLMWNTFSSTLKLFNNHPCHSLRFWSCTE